MVPRRVWRGAFGASMMLEVDTCALDGAFVSAGLGERVRRPGFETSMMLVVVILVKFLDRRGGILMLGDILLAR